MACWYPSPWWPRWDVKKAEEEKPATKRRVKAKKKQTVTT